MSYIDRILRLPDVMAAVGLKKTAIYELIKSGAFPAQLKLGKYAVGWKESEVQAWIRARDGRQPANGQEVSVQAKPVRCTEG